MFANQSENDILCRSELDKLDKKHDNLHVWYTVDKVQDQENWDYDTGFINKAMIS